MNARWIATTAALITLTAACGAEDAEEGGPVVLFGSPEATEGSSNREMEPGTPEATNMDSSPATPDTRMCTCAPAEPGEPPVMTIDGRSPTRSGDRLVARKLVTGDGAESFLGWRDTGLGFDCEIRSVDGGRYCLPSTRARVDLRIGLRAFRDNGRLGSNLELFPNLVYPDPACEQTPTLMVLANGSPFSGEDAQAEFDSALCEIAFEGSILRSVVQGLEELDQVCREETQQNEYERFAGLVFVGEQVPRPATLWVKNLDGPSACQEVSIPDSNDRGPIFTAFYEIEATLAPQELVRFDEVLDEP